jgi:serine phosphatase RsbU (regulator of sigma subunit)
LLDTGDVLVLYSDGVTEAENDEGHPFEEQGLQRVLDHAGSGSAKELGWATFEAVERHVQQRRLLDDLTVLVARRLPPLPAAAVAAPEAIGV